MCVTMLSAYLGRRRCGARCSHVAASGSPGAFDDGLADVGALFQSAARWEAVITEYARSVVPMDLFEYRIECGAAPMWLLVRSRKVIAASGHGCPTTAGAVGALN